MKKTYAIGLCAVAAACMAAACGSTNALQKERERMYKAKIKEYHQEGWKLAGSSKTLEVALLEHYELLGKDNSYELAGEVSQCQSINVCKQAAYNNALIAYANAAGSFLRGRIAADNSLNQTSGEEFDKMYSGYERLVQAEIKGSLRESYGVVKENGKNKQYRLFFVVNEDEASKARLRALEQAAKETKAAQEYANQITDFVREGFKVEQ